MNTIPTDAVVVAALCVGFIIFLVYLGISHGMIGALSRGVPIAEKKTPSVWSRLGHLLFHPLYWGKWSVVSEGTIERRYGPMGMPLDQCRLIVKQVLIQERTCQFCGRLQRRQQEY